jgi:tRNA-Thr(GGU) m(6)t(6)A37 methyltransferase TsaA
MELVLKPIAIVESCYRDRFAVPRQPLLVEDAWAFLRFNSQLQPEISLQGLEGYSHLWVIFGFHLNNVSRFHAKVHPPRLGGESMGLFATRTPHRPNPLGLSLVAIKNFTAEGIEITGADLADGTPVYDVKPYLPEVEALPHARGGWSSMAEKPKIPVRFENPDLEAKMLEWGIRIEQPNIIRLVVQTLEQDPRPQVYKDSGKGYKDAHAFRLFNGDIHFRMTNEQFVIFDLKFIPNSLTS